MNDIPNELKYTSTHEWVKQEDDGTVTIGITDTAQTMLGDLVFVDLPEAGSEVNSGDECAVVESVKSASDIYAPLSGEIVAVNDELKDNPELVNRSPYEGGWIIRLRPSDSSELNGLLDAETYQEHVSTDEE
jgi:glycine cleavage system H protein